MLISTSLFFITFLCHTALTLFQIMPSFSYMSACTTPVCITSRRSTRPTIIVIIISACGEGNAHVFEVMSNAVGYGIW